MTLNGSGVCSAAVEDDCLTSYSITTSAATSKVCDECPREAAECQLSEVNSCRTRPVVKQQLMTEAEFAHLHHTLPLDVSSSTS
jgi:hypothetical protein